MKGKVMKLCSMIASFAFVIAVSGVEHTCIWLYHQPKVPETLIKSDK